MPSRLMRQQSSYTARPGSGLGVEADAVVRALQGDTLVGAGARAFDFGDALAAV